MFRPDGRTDESNRHNWDEVSVTHITWGRNGTCGISTRNHIRNRQLGKPKPKLGNDIKMNLIENACRSELDCLWIEYSH
jgi:hypothetical protein